MELVEQTPSSIKVARKIIILLSNKLGKIMSKTILIPLSNGTEDMEAVISIDILRRAEYLVTVASTMNFVTFAKGVKVRNEILIDSLDEDYLFDAIVLPGGLNGVKYLKNEDKLLRIIKHHFDNNKLIAAVCAAPLILKECGILDSETKLTSHPSVKGELSEFLYQESNVVLYNNIMTSRGAGTTFDFALSIIDYFGDTDLANNVADSVVYERRFRVI